MIINKNPILIPLPREERNFAIGKDSFFSIGFLLLVIVKLIGSIVKKFTCVNLVIKLVTPMNHKSFIQLQYSYRLFYSLYF